MKPRFNGNHLLFWRLSRYSSVKKKPKYGVKQIYLIEIIYIFVIKIDK